MDNAINHLNESLKCFKLDAYCVGAEQHRHFGFFDLKLGPSCQVSHIQRKVNEISLKIQSIGVPIVKVIPRSGIVRLQVILGDPEKIDLSTMFETSTRPSGLLQFLLGESDDGKDLWADMSQNPHMIVAGAPGSGKSVLLHNMIANAAKHEDVTLYLCDPKGVEFNHYRDEKTNKLIAGIASSYDETLEMLDYLIEEMEDRYKILAEYKKQSIEQFPNTFNKIMFIIDEASDLMLQDRSKQFETKLVRLAQKSRAAGIYLVLGTQRPSVDVITGLIKANFEGRIACRVSSKTDSQIILGIPGAERLVGKGDAIISTKVHNFARMQIAHITPEEILEKYIL